jgi:hypothetical protein
VLPKIVHPTFSLALPVSGKKVTYRPWTVGEEKALLVAKQSKEATDVFTGVLEVAKAVTGIDVLRLPTFEVEWLFVKARIVSVDGSAKVTYVDPDDLKEWEFDVDLTKVVLTEAPAKNATIQVTKEVSIELRYLPASVWLNPKVATGDFETMAALSIEKVWEGDQVYPAESVPEEELIEFARSLPAKIAEEIADFWSSAPHLSYTIEYTNSMGTEKKVELSSLTDFFSFA